jgi:hypothetical protein
MEWCPRCPGSADRLVCPGGRYCRFLDPEDPAHDPRYREVLERRLRGFPMPSQGIQAVIPWGSESVVIRETVGKVEDTFQAVPGSENVTIPVTVPSVPPYPGGEQIRLSVAAARALGARMRACTHRVAPRCGCQAGEARCTRGYGVEPLGVVTYHECFVHLQRDACDRSISEGGSTSAARDPDKPPEPTNPQD